MSEPLRPYFPPNEDSSVKSNGTLSLPTEIWEKIFWMASEIQSFNEFSDNPQEYADLECFNSEYEAIHASLSSEGRIKPVKVAMGLRLEFTLVCRRWASIGLRILWSHLCLKPRYLCDIWNILLLNPRYGAYIRRITIQTSTADLNPSSNRLQTLEEMVALRHIFTFCPHLFIYDGPIQSNFVFPIALKHASLRNTATDFDEPMSSLANITSLTLSSARQINTTRPLTLHKLVCLSIPRLDSGEKVLAAWDLPNLSTLSMYGGSMSEVFSFIRKYAQSLQVLQIPWIVLWGQWDPTERLFHLPKLTHIYARVDSQSETIDSLRLFHPSQMPNLQVFGMYSHFIMSTFTANGKAREGQRLLITIANIHDWCLPSVTFCFAGSKEFISWLKSDEKLVRAFESLKSDSRGVQYHEIEAPS